MGLETGDDGAVVRLSDDIAVIQTVDFFMPIVDDPVDFGRIAAANSLSDVYAMGGVPVTALAILGLPIGKLDASVGAAILEGAGSVCQSAGIQIVGGHSIDDAEPKFGLSVTGRVHPDQIWKNSGGCAGDHLVLTKPLGSGTLTTAIKKGALTPVQERNVVEIMCALNDTAAAAARTVGVHAATDVTGFALLGHAIEIAEGSGLGLDLDLSALPVIDGALDMLNQGIAPGATRRNLEYYGDRVEWSDSVTDIQKKLVGDPQTSGGLLLSVAPERSTDLIQALREQGTLASAVVGTLSASPGIRVG